MQPPSQTRLPPYNWQKPPASSKRCYQHPNPHRKHTRQKWQLLFYFYRDTRQNEIDLLIREGDIYYPIEIKSTASPQRKMLDNFGVLKGDTIKRGPGALICTCDEPRYLTSDVVALPVWAL